MVAPIEKYADIGEAINAIVRSVDPKQYERLKRPHVHARSAGRMLEEAVEAALVFGLPPAGIMAHVMDAIYNESRKAGQYPGQLTPRGDPFDKLTELADMELQIEHLRFLAQIPRHKLDDHVRGKLIKLRQWAEQGEMTMVDGLMYRRGVRSPTSVKSSG